MSILSRGLTSPYQYDWSEDLGIMHCIIPYKTTNGIWIEGDGSACCHPDDECFKSQLTGGIIAEYRAEIDVLRQLRDMQVKPGIAALEHLLSTMQQSPKYNDNSYEARRIKRELKNYYLDLRDIANLIQDLQHSLSEYIKGKDEIHSRLIKSAKNK